jgi:esterase/lipase
MINVGGPSSEIENEVRKKYIKINEIEKIIENPQNYKRNELERVKNKIYDLLLFYNRIINSINATINRVKRNGAISYKQKKDMYYQKQEKELYTAKREKTKISNYYRKINEILKNINNIKKGVT